MSHPSDEELAELALTNAEARAADGADAAEAPRGGPGGAPGVAAHVAACSRCARVVEELRDARDSARRALATAGAAGPSDDAGADRRWVTPAPEVWGRIEAEITADAVGPPAGPAHGAPVEAPTGRTAEAPDDGGSADSAAVVSLDDHRRATARRRAAGWASGIAAASLALGLLSGWAIWGGERTERTTTIVTAALDTLDTKQPEGEAALVQVDGALDIEVSPAQALDPGTGYLEVWLINTDGKRMVSIGVLRPGQTALFPVSQSLIDQGYVIVDISREQFDDQPAHSGDSLLRGELRI